MDWRLCGDSSPLPRVAGKTKSPLGLQRGLITGPALGLLVKRCGHPATALTFSSIVFFYGPKGVEEASGLAPQALEEQARLLQESRASSPKRHRKL